MTEIQAMRAVYSYYLPEVRELVSRIARDYPHEVFLRSAMTGLDAFHEPIVDRLVAAHATDIPALGEFTSRYPTNGSEEGIREYMSQLAARGVRRAYALEGDYEGYSLVGATRGIEVLSVPESVPPASLEPSYWFLSNPSARDGNLLPPATISAILDANHKVFYDLSYLDSTLPSTYDVSHPNVDAVAISFSKTYGLFYYRIGFLFTRAPVDALYANRWFKNIFSLIVAYRVISDLDRHAIAVKYKAIQRKVIAKWNEVHGLPLRESDSFLLAHLPLKDAENLDAERKALLEKFQRANAYRLCLTPEFLATVG